MHTHMEATEYFSRTVGKSTFFNILTKSEAPAENFPFSTIDPNESRVPVPDQRFDFLCDFYKPGKSSAIQFKLTFSLNASIRDQLQPQS